MNAIQEISFNRNRATIHAEYNRISGTKRLRSEETEKECKWNGNGKFSSSEFQPNQYFAQAENDASETEETVEQGKL